MDRVDPDTLLEWLQMGAGEERDLQLMALEQLCMLLLMSDNIDRCFESCPPRSFLPALGRIFLDETAPENILEVTARAITYYLDVSNECTRRITQVDGAVKAICNRLVAADMTDRTRKDLAEQCVKLLEHICQREASAVYDAGGLQCMLLLIRRNDRNLHKDTMHSAMNVITRLCSKVDPHDQSLLKCSSDLGALLSHDDSTISECALRCFAALTDRFIRKSLDPANLAVPSGLIGRLIDALAPMPEELKTNEVANTTRHSSAFISVVLSLISNLCRGSAVVTDQVTSSPKLIPAIKSVLNSRDERCVMDSLRLADLLVVFLCEGRGFLPKVTASSNAINTTSVDRTNRQLIDTIRQHDIDTLMEAVESGAVDANFADDVGQTLLNWCSAFGTIEMVTYLCKKGADPNKGQRSSSLHYAACFGRPEIIKILLCHGANPDLHDEEGRTALEKARERNDDAHQRIVQILESPSSYAIADEANNASTSSPWHDSTDNNSETIENVSIDKVLRKNILQELIPIFCNIYRNTLLSSVRRSTLLLMRKCIFHLSNEDINELVENEKKIENDMRLAENDFVANLMTVLGTAFGYDDDIDGKEQAVLLMKHLLEKNNAFWLEQLIRLGIYEKVEALAANHGNHQGNTQTNAQVPLTATCFDGNLDNRSISSISSVGSVNIQMDAENASGYASHHHFDERTEMINIPVEKNNLKHASDANSKVSSTIDKDNSRIRSSSMHASVVSTTIYPRLTSQLASVHNDLVEAATAVAQVLGVEVVDAGENDGTIVGSGAHYSKQNAVEHASQSQTLASGINYKWSSWRLIRHSDAFYVWCDAVVIEFSESSNGWIRFILNGRLSTMFSSGKVEPCSNEMDSRTELIGKIRQTKYFTEALPHELFTKFTYLKAGNWRIKLDSADGNQMFISNVDGLPHERTLIIKSDAPGFTFVNGKNVTRTFSVESILDTDFMTGWTACSGVQHTETHTNIQRKKLYKLAKELWDNHLKEARRKPRDALLALQDDALAICSLVNDIYKMEFGLNTATDEYDSKITKMSNVLKKVRHTIIDNRLLSTFELSVSNIVPALLHLLEVAIEKNCKPLVKCFRMVFSDNDDFYQLVRRIVLVLEYVEKFPQPLYDVPGGSSFGLQLLTGRFNLRLEQADAEDAEAQNHFMNRTDRTMKAEPLATIGSLRQYVYKMVVRNWYDHPRENLTFVQRIKQHKAVGDELTFVYESDFDTNGVLWYLGTNGQTVDDWTNPAIAKVVNVYCSDGANQLHGQPMDILSRDIHAINCHTSDSPNANFTIDLGVWLYPTKYTLRHAQDRGNSSLRNWFLQGSRDAFVWEVLAIHKNEQTLNESGDTATWSIDDYNDDDLKEKRTPMPRRGPYRYFRVAQNGYNASGTSHILSLSGFEIYGAIVDVVSCELKPIEMQREVSGSSIKSLSSTNNATSSGITALSSLIASKKQRQSLKDVIFDSKSSDNTKSATPETSLHDFPSFISQRPTTIATRHTISMRKHRQKCSILDKNAQPSDKNENSEKTDSNTLALRQKISYSAGTNSKIRMFRTHCNQSVNGTSSCDSFSEQRSNSITPFKSLLKIGARIVPGPDSSLWKNTEIVGTVIGIEKNGWVDVQWDDGNINTYRFGHDGKYEVDLQIAQDSKKPIAGILKSSKHFCSAINHDVTNLSAIEDIEEQHQLYNSKMDVPTSVPTINQKSMSATNLFDEKPAQYSVATSKQAASAESLQHQTPSLENLLARSRLQADRILEIVGDELQSPTSADSRPFGSQESYNRNDTTDKSSISMNAFTGGSQPMLSVTHDPPTTPNELLSSADNCITAERDNLLSITQNSMTSEDIERDRVAELVKLPSSFMKRFSTDASDDKTAGKNSNRKECRSMSISEPNLLESTNNRQKSIEPSLADFANSAVSELNVVKMERQNSEQRVPIIALSLKTISPTQNDNPEHSSSTITSDMFMDTDYLNRFINSAEFCEHANISDSTNSKVTKDEIGDNVIDKYVEDSILSEFIMSNHDQENVTNEPNDGNLVANMSREDLPSTNSSNRLINSKQQQLAGFGNGLKARLGNYADVLRGVMQQVVASSSGMLNGNFDSDSMADEIFDDGFVEAKNLIENNCDHMAAGEFIPHNFFTEIESLASATAVIRQHLASPTDGRGLLNIESSSSSSSLSALMAAVSNANHWSGSVVVGTPSINVPHTSLSSGTTRESKLNWRQLFHGNNLCDDYNKTRNNAMNRSAVSAQRRAQRVWDDDYVLRRQFGALIPAFDPRPGRNNINQTQEVELSNDADARYVRRNSIVKQFFYSSPFKAEFEAAKKIRLHLKGPNLPNVENKIFELSDGDVTLFRYVNQLCESVNWTDFMTSSGKLTIPGLTSFTREQQHRSRKIWEPTYTLIYTCCSESENISANENIIESAVTEDGFDETVQQSLRLAQLLKSVMKQMGSITITDEAFHSSKLTQKLSQCLTDPLLVTANALPTWCGRLIFDFPYLFSTKTRELYLKATAFGTSRTIAWLQSRRDQIIEHDRTSLPIGTGGTGYRREDHYQEYRIGRLKHERIKVYRDESSLLDNAMRVMNFHAMRKSVLEIEYYGEEGTGLGPTLEFYAIVAAEFQRKSLAMWLCDDMDEQEMELESELDLGEGRKPPGYYVQRKGGLFPGYYPQKTEGSAKVAELFKTLGIFLAKVLLDDRLVDIPLSSAFLKLLLTPSVCSENVSNLKDVLGIDDLAHIHPLKAKFLISLKEFIARRNAITSSNDLNSSEKCKLLDELHIGNNERSCKLEDLALTFALNPPSRVFGWHSVELIENGASIDVTIDNVHDYVDKCVNFYLNEGIKEQVIAFREGFDLVFPLKSLTCFTSDEVQSLLFGEQCPQWSRDDLLRYTEPKLGYTRDSPVYLRFIDVLTEMSSSERKAFLQFATGCASLPPGGLANLHPSLTIVRKVDAETSAGSGGDGAYPSVNTCVHYLKLPEYSSTAILRERLLAATYEKGFHLN